MARLKPRTRNLIQETAMKRNVNPHCPCRLQNNNENAHKHQVPAFEQCCQPYLQGTAFPDTAEQLMRSRYSAFVLEHEDYLLASWHPKTRPEHIEFDPACKWLGLKIIQTRLGQSTDNKGWVEFVARYKIDGKAERIEELSYFLKDNNVWLYHSAVENMDQA
jgi:SEC-C motif-containing protein